MLPKTLILKGRRVHFLKLAKQFSPGGLLMYVFYVLLFLLIFLFSGLTTPYIRPTTIFNI